MLNWNHAHDPFVDADRHVACLARETKDHGHLAILVKEGLPTDIIHWDGSPYEAAPSVIASGWMTADEAKRIAERQFGNPEHASN